MSLLESVTSGCRADSSRSLTRFSAARVGACQRRQRQPEPGSSVARTVEGEVGNGLDGGEHNFGLAIGEQGYEGGHRPAAHHLGGIVAEVVWRRPRGVENRYDGT